MLEKVTVLLIASDSSYRRRKPRIGDQTHSGLISSDVLDDTHNRSRQKNRAIFADNFHAHFFIVGFTDINPKSAAPRSRLAKDYSRWKRASLKVQRFA